MTRIVTKPKQLIHKEYHWKNGVRYLLKFYRTQHGVKSEMTMAKPQESDSK